MSHCNIIIISLLLLVISYAPGFEARTKLLKNMEDKKIVPSHIDASILMNSLQKGNVPPSSPSDKGHAELVNVKHFNVDHNIESVPSPGIGN
ncbi:hypothetical protein R3W88_032946 [Solanum pinnatisectum]|uniref:Uncharacterized protein n=1 Tax=Solanum pinnatisectum TaxID=50273 RepID=A0AAV9LU35_9SOLN|nr:hypothetical protein R3W88_032946 [Solanum pinnatisectum]